MGDNSIVKAIQQSRPESVQRKRGRPSLSEHDVALRQLRLEHFGEAMRKFRESAELTIAEASRAVDGSSPRRLLQYEGVCFPPGNILDDIARAYGVDPDVLGRLVLSHSDPELFEIICDKPGYTPSATEIQKRIEKNRADKAKPEDKAKH